MIGQLYQVKTRAEFKADGSIEKCTFVIHAASREDALLRLNYSMASDTYRNFSVLKIEKVREVHRISSRIFGPQALADLPAELKIESEDEFSVSGASQRTNQPEGRGLFAVGIGGKIRAADVDQALRKLGDYLTRRGLGQTAENPLRGGGTIMVEQEGEVDSTVTTASQLRRMDATHFRDQRPLAGGAVGSGKR